MRTDVPRAFPALGPVGDKDRSRQAARPVRPVALLSHRSTGLLLIALRRCMSGNTHAEFFFKMHDAQPDALRAYRVPHLYRLAGSRPGRANECTYGVDRVGSLLLHIGQARVRRCVAF